jgi:hypothetical protein
LPSPTFSLLTGQWLDFHQLADYHASRTAVRGDAPGQHDQPAGDLHAQQIGVQILGGAIDDCLNKVKSTYKDQVKTLLNPKFQLFTKSASMPA